MSDRVVQSLVGMLVSVVPRVGSALAVIVALVVGLEGAALAQDDTVDDGLPAGKFGISAGVRQGLGGLGTDFGPGVVSAVEAGYHLSGPDSVLSPGLHWSVAWGWFGFDDEASLTGSLKLLEFNFGARVRRLIGSGVPRFVALGGGMTLLRSNVPIPPDLKRTYFGPYVTVGIEQYLSREFLLSFEARYGLISGGPGGISISLGIAFGR